MGNQPRLGIERRCSGYYRQQHWRDGLSDVRCPRDDRLEGLAAADVAASKLCASRALLRSDVAVSARRRSGETHVDRQRRNVLDASADAVPSVV